MKVELQSEGGLNITLDILFWKTNPGERRKANGKELIDTTCQISTVERDGSLKLIASAVARQNPLDNYNKIVGKKVGLTKALGKISFSSLLGYLSALELRTRRQHIWNVFHQTFGRWN